MAEIKKKQQFNYRTFLINRKSLGIAIGLGVVSVGLVLFAIIPQFQETLELNTQFKKEKPKLARLQSKLVELDNIQFSPEFSQRGFVEAALPSKKPLLELLTSLHTISEEDNVSVEEFSLSPGLVATNEAEIIANAKQKANSAGVDTIDVEMVVTGTFSDVGKFLINLEKISPFTTITQLGLSSRSSGDDFNQEESDMRAKISTKSYFFTQSVAASIEAPLPTLNILEQSVLKDLADFSDVDLPEQLEITGGLEDLFGVDPLEFE
jgi:Tfp pilus assembly protein PilO